MILENVPCPKCGKIGYLNLKFEETTEFFYGEDIPVKKYFRKCAACLEEHENSVDHDWRLDLYAEHRRRKNLTTVEELNKWMSKYDLYYLDAANILGIDSISFDRFQKGSNLPSTYDNFLLPVRLGLPPIITIGEELLGYKRCYIQGGFSPQILVIYQNKIRELNQTEFVAKETYLTSEHSGYFRYCRTIHMIERTGMFLDDKPTQFWENIDNERYNKCISNIYGPSIIEWDIFGNKRFEQYWFQGEITRSDGPSTIKWDQNGNIIEFWFRKNKNDMTERAKNIMEDWDLPESFDWNEDQRLKFKLAF